MTPFDIILAFAAASSTPNPDYIRLAEKDWEDTGLAQVTVVSRKCGMENAFYTPLTRTVTMCKELYRKPALALFIFNHEMGHALMHQNDIPNSERGADEIAVLTSTPESTMAAMFWFMNMASEGDDGDDGVHQSHRDRAASLMCLMDGLYDQPVSRVCKAYAGSVDENWARLLIMIRK